MKASELAAIVKYLFLTNKNGLPSYLRCCDDSSLHIEMEFTLRAISPITGDVISDFGVISLVRISCSHGQNEGTRSYRFIETSSVVLTAICEHRVIIICVRDLQVTMIII